MPTIPQPNPSALAKTWLVPVLAAGVAAAAVFSYSRSAETQAAPGSPYYDRAVKEAMNGLVNPGGAAAAAAAATPDAIPPLPAGLSPAEHYWCKNCKAYHKNQPAGADQPGGGAQPGADPAAQPGAAPAAQPGAAPAAEPGTTIPPLLAGLSPDDYDWCANCKVFHPKAKPGAAQPAAALPADTIPPLPAQFSPNDYYWCKDCKAYHPHQSATPIHPPAGTPAPGP
ncbi:MAG: hypothetical protein RLZZ522_579 [Verrucomicrobiota bacterium]